MNIIQIIFSEITFIFYIDIPIQLLLHSQPRLITIYDIFQFNLSFQSLTKLEIYNLISCFQQTQLSNKLQQAQITDCGFMDHSNSKKDKRSKNRKKSFELTSKVFVTNIYSQRSEDSVATDFKKLFNKFGKVLKLVIRKSKSGEHLFGFIQYQNVEDATRAIKQMNQYEYNSQPIKVRQDRQNQGCFFCKKVGHFAKQCPLRNQQDMVGYKYNQIYGYTKQGRQSLEKSSSRQKMSRKLSSSQNVSSKKRSPLVQKQRLRQKKARDIQKRIFSDQELDIKFQHEKMQNEHQPQVEQRQYLAQQRQQYIRALPEYGHDNDYLQYGKFMRVHYQNTDQPVIQAYQRNRNGLLYNYGQARDYDGTRNYTDFRDYHNARQFGFKDQIAYRDFIESQYLRTQNYIRSLQQIDYRSYQRNRLRDLDFQRERFTPYPYINVVQRGIRHQIENDVNSVSSSSSESSSRKSKDSSRSKDKKHSKKHKRKHKKSSQKKKKNSHKSRQKKSKHKKHKSSKSKKSRKRSVSSSSSFSSQSSSEGRQYYQHTQHSQKKNKDKNKTKESLGVIGNQKELKTNSTIPSLDQEKKRKTGIFDCDQLQNQGRK